jgi:hypothetical protein
MPNETEVALDHVEAIHDGFFIYLKHGIRNPPTLASALNLSYQRLDPEDYADLQEFLKDILLDYWENLQANRQEESTAPRNP